MKQIPNIFTLLNLFFGCIAIMYALQTGVTLTSDNNGDNLVIIPEKIYMASLFIGLAAVIDFLDGFIARLLNATSLMGKQLDSLADVVSFGVAPGMIVYQFLRLSYTQQEDGLDIKVLWLMPAFIIPCMSAYRLARFNVNADEDTSFKGVPTPAIGLLIASFPMVYWYSNTVWAVSLLTSKWFWYAVIFAVSYLMVSSIPILSLKFKNTTLKNLLPFIILAIVLGLSAILLKWMCVGITFATYIIVSIIFKQKIK